MSINLTDVVQITVAGRASGQQVLNVFHFRHTAADVVAGDDADIPTALGLFIGRWRNVLAQSVHESYTVEVYRWRTLRGTVVNPSPPPPTMFTEGPALDIVGGLLDKGGLTNDPLPTFDALGVQKLSDRAGRNYRGSCRIGPNNEPSSTGNSWTATFILNSTAPLVALFADPYDVTFSFHLEMCVFSRTLALAAPPPFTLLRDLTAKVTGPKLNGFVTSQVSRKQSVTQPT